MKLNFGLALAATSILAGIAPKEVKEVKDTTRTRVEKNPTNGADIRIMASGKVYPSAQFVSEFGLEYQAQNSSTKSMGFDLFNSINWQQLQGAPQMLLGYVIDQSKPKVELFAGSRYDKTTGEPINSVLEQGTVLSDETLELIATALGYSKAEPTHQVMGTESTEKVSLSAWEVMLGNRQYVDLYVARSGYGDFLKVPDNTYLIPKQVERGEKKGEWVTTKREGIEIRPVVEYTDEVRAELQQEQQEDTGLAKLNQVIDNEQDEAEEEVALQNAEA